METIGKYQINENSLLGKGAFSVVYKGIAPDGNEVAIKVLNKSVKTDIANNEVAIIRRLRHPHIVQFLDILIGDKSTQLVYEFCEGGDLMNWIRQNDLSVPTRDTFQDSPERRFICELAQGIEFLHANQVIHRDLKPHNILISHSHIKIGDFGLAKSFDKEDDMFSTLCGSPMYMAPEVLLCKSYGTSYDIWSLGIIVFEVITKRHPYPYSNRRLLMEKVNALVESMGRATLDICFTSISGISEDITQIIRHMLNKDSDRRPCATEIREFFERLDLEDTCRSFKFMGDDDMTSHYESLESCDAPPSTPEGCRPRSLSNIAINDRYIEQIISSSPNRPMNYVLGSTPPQHTDLFTSLSKSINKSISTVIGLVKKSSSY